MSLKDCLRVERQKGNLSKDEANAWEGRFDDLVRAGMSEAQAKERILVEMDAELLDRKRRGLLATVARQDRELDALGHTDRQGRADPTGGAVYLLEHHGQAKFQDAEHKRLAILGQAHAEMEEVLYEFRKGSFTGDLRRSGGETWVRLQNVVRELFGEATGDVRAKELAEAWTRTAEALRQRFNYAGGAVARLEKWGLPQVHDMEALLAKGRDAWIAFIRPRLDPARMKNPLTGQPMTAADLQGSLEHIYDTITREGWSARAGVGPGAGAMFRRHGDHRFLVFKSADDWLAYQREFGEGDPFAAMMGHISTMSRDIALMELFGPNPHALWYSTPGNKGLLETLLDAAPDKAKALRDNNRFNDMWAHITGTANMPVGTRLANTVAGARNLISASSLGSATLSALSDMAFGIFARQINGLPILPVLSSYIRQFTTANTREAVRAGLILDSSVHAMHQQARYLGSLSGRSWTAYINDRVLTYSGLLAWTQAGKHAFGLAMQAELADQVGKALADVPAALQRTLRRHGFDEAAWDQLRGADLGDNARGGLLYQPEPGAVFLRPREVGELVDQSLADRYTSMILRETRFAVPESTLRSRSWLVSTNQPGTLGGEVMRSIGQFKSFGVAVVMLWGARAASEMVRLGPVRGALWGSAFLITSAVFGAFSIQLKEIKDGRDPRDMNPLDKMGRKFWGAALLQSGGFGIYGDFLFSDVNRFGGSMAGTVGGPLIDRLGNLRNLTIGNFVEFGQGEEKTHFGREAAQFLRQNTPGASLWYTRLAWDRVLMDQLQAQVDPDAHRAFHRRAARRRREFGNEFWWAPGRREPTRMPQLGRALGQR